VGLARALPDVPLALFFHASAVLELDVLHARRAPARDRLAATALRAPLAALERSAVDRAARIMVLSRYSRGLLETREPAAGSRARLVPGAVDTERFAPGDRAAARERLRIAPHERVVFTVRRLVPRMGLEELVDAATTGTGAGGYRLVVAGAGPLAEPLEQRRAASPRGDAVTLLGRIDDDELVRWYRAADLVCVPTVAYEGFGLVTAEALASGTPVVGTPVGATPELLEPLDSSLVARGATAADLAEAITRTLDRSSEELRLRCRAYALERFAWPQAAEAWERVLEEAAAEPPPRPAPVVKRFGRALDRRLPIDLKAARNSAVAVTREGIGRTVRRSGAGALAARLGDSRRAGILLYHNPAPETLSAHLEHLSRRHEFVPYAAVADAVRTGAWSDLPARSLAVVFDDGHADNAALVPVLEAFGVHATIFLCTGIVGTGRRYWWTLEELTVPNRDRLMTVPDDDRLRALEELAGYTPLREYPGAPQALSILELEQLAPHFSFEAHTRLHPILPMCSDEQAREEIAGSKADVERLTGRPCTAFAYPNGRYGPRELALVREAGFTSARTELSGWNTPETSPYELRVLGMPDDATVDVVAAQVTGLPFLRDLMYLT
jgi:glycosyltransferase involved in cell wall biosynthesis/peptidoglycan/xylan/chitin deacetylase (PgdA/CDA1 family)